MLWPTREVLGNSTISTYASEIESAGQKLNYRDDSTHLSRFFTSQNNRKILEKEFLLAGLKIRTYSSNPSRALKPLGFSPFEGFGFGAMVFTYRNCPNNCPLALWWGNPKAEKTHPFSKWYPLMERKTYENKVDFDIMDILKL